MKRTLLSLPELAGHRQVYCRELCDYFLSRDFSVTVATDVSRLQEFNQLDTLAGHSRVHFIRDTWTCEARASEQLRGLVGVVRESDAEVTFLGEADQAIGLLAAQIVRPRLRLPGRRVGLFLHSTNYVHSDTCVHTGRLGRAILASSEYRPVSLTQPRVFHEIVMRHCTVLDRGLCLDEVFVSKHADRYGWLPDIAATSSDAGADGTEAAAWDTGVSEFIAAHRGKPVVVYTGTPQARRGYEVLLQLARDVGGCFIHCGKSDDACGYPPENLEARTALVSGSAILESGMMYRSFETARATLRAATCVVLPYVGHLGSSGVMLQALMAGRPVLVPDEGLMGWRVRNFGVGLTFSPGDLRDMRNKFSILQSTPPKLFADAIGRFLAYFSRIQFEAAMDGALGLRQGAARLPSTGDIGSTAVGARRQ